MALSTEETEFRYGVYNSDGLPFGANLIVDGMSIATIMFAPAYINTPFAVVYRGVVYCGILLDEEIVLGSIDVNILITASGEQITDQEGNAIRTIQSGSSEDSSGSSEDSSSSSEDSSSSSEDSSSSSEDSSSSSEDSSSSSEDSSSSSEDSI